MQPKLAESFYPNGTLKSSGMKAGRFREGVWRLYHKNGQLHEMLTYADKKRNGPALTYNKQGILAAEGNYLNDLRNGMWKYYNDHGLHVETRIYLNDTLHGEVLLYFDEPVGVIRVRHVYQHNNPQYSITYYPNGTTMEESHYTGTDPLFTAHGDVKTYYPTGQIKSIDTYINGLLHGTSITYTSDGSIVERKIYVKGNRVV